MHYTLYKLYMIDIYVLNDFRSDIFVICVICVLGNLVDCVSWERKI